MATALALGAIVSFGQPARLLAQEEASPTGVEVSAEPAGANAEPAGANAEPAGTNAAPVVTRQPLPVMVIVLPGRRVPEEATAAASAALVEQLTPLAGGRPVHALGAAALLEAIAACDDDACLGAQLASAQAQAGVVLRLERTRTALSARLELRDPVSGTARGELIEGTLPRDPAGIPEALSALSAQLEPTMPSPPPPPATLLVTVNVDGAHVRIDGDDVGEAPLSAVEVAEGSHEVQVLMPGYMSVLRRTEVGPGQQARLDVTLSEMGAEVGGSASGGEGAWAVNDEGSGELIEQWWFWTIIGGGAAVLLGIAIGVGVAVSSQDSGMQDPMGIPLPPITGGL